MTFMIDLVTTGVMPDNTHMTATKAQYHALRESIGSQKEVAKMLGVDIRTVQRRESGEIRPPLSPVPVPPMTPPVKRKFLSGADTGIPPDPY